MTQVFDVAVVGLGAMGSAALCELARRGVRAVGIERFEPGHDRGSSHGESRIIRLSYFEHPSYVPLLRRAYEKWRELERRCGDAILTATGILEAGRPGSVVVAGSLAASRLHGLAHEELDAAQAMRRYPAFRFPADWSAVFQPDGGFLRPERAIGRFVALAAHDGAVVQPHTRVLDIAPGAGAVTIRTDRGSVEAGAVILAAGAWIGAFAPDLAPRLTLTRQVLGWFTPLDPALLVPGRFPVFLLDGGEDGPYYGFPDFAGTGVKVAAHGPRGVLASAEDLRQDGGANDEAELRMMLERFIPWAAGSLARMRTCIYTRTPDEDFAVGVLPGDARIVLASPCSGHGFKFASVMGEVLADLALDGRTRHDIGRFRLDRFGPPQAA